MRMRPEPVRVVKRPLLDYRWLDPENAAERGSDEREPRQVEQLDAEHHLTSGVRLRAGSFHRAPRSFAVLPVLGAVLRCLSRLLRRLVDAEVDAADILAQCLWRELHPAQEQHADDGGTPPATDEGPTRLLMNTGHQDEAANAKGSRTVAHLSGLTEKLVNPLSQRHQLAEGVARPADGAGRRTTTLPLRVTCRHRRCRGTACRTGRPRRPRTGGR